jgi:hypothetical protein
MHDVIASEVLEKRFKNMYWQVILMQASIGNIVTLSFLCTWSWREAYRRGLQHGVIHSEPHFLYEFSLICFCFSCAWYICHYAAFKSLRPVTEDCI